MFSMKAPTDWLLRAEVDPAMPDMTAGLAPTGFEFKLEILPAREQASADAQAAVALPDTVAELAYRVLPPSDVVPTNGSEHQKHAL